MPHPYSSYCGVNFIFQQILESLAPVPRPVWNREQPPRPTAVLEQILKEMLDTLLWVERQLAMVGSAQLSPALKARLETYKKEIEDCLRDLRQERLAGLPSLPPKRLSEEQLSDRLRSALRTLPVSLHSIDCEFEKIMRLFFSAEKLTEILKYPSGIAEVITVAEVIFTHIFPHDSVNYLEDFIRLKEMLDQFGYTNEEFYLTLILGVFMFIIWVYAYFMNMISVLKSSNDSLTRDYIPYFFSLSIVFLSALYFFLDDTWSYIKETKYFQKQYSRTKNGALNQFLLFEKMILEKYGRPRVMGNGVKNALKAILLLTLGASFLMPVHLIGSYSVGTAVFTAGAVGYAHRVGSTAPSNVSKMIYALGCLGVYATTLYGIYHSPTLQSFVNDNIYCGRDARAMSSQSNRNSATTCFADLMVGTLASALALAAQVGAGELVQRLGHTVNDAMRRGGAQAEHWFQSFKAAAVKFDAASKSVWDDLGAPF